MFLCLSQACKVTAQLNCVTGIKRDCVSTAQSLGDKSAADLPLYGIPVSLKECMKTEVSFMKKKKRVN